MKTRKLLLAAGTLLTMAAVPAFAHDAGTWILRAGVGTVAPDSNNYVENDGVTTTTVSVDDGTSLTLSGTYMFSPHWGFDILAAYPFNHDVKLSVVDNADPVFNAVSIKAGETDQLPPTFSIQYHLLPDANFQPYIGAGLNWTTFFNSKVTQQLTDATGITGITLDDSFGAALQVGADWVFSNSWLINFDVRWIDIDSDLSASDGTTEADVGTLNIDPWVYAINIGYRF